MKTKHIYLFLSLLTIILFACDPETKEEKLDSYIEAGDNAKNKNVYTDAIEYNDAIVGLQTKIVVEILKFMPMNDIDSLRKQVNIIQKEILSSTEILGKISCSKDQNDKFKNETILMFNCYNKLYVESWGSFLDEMDNENIDNYSDYNENISETLNDKIYNIYMLEIEAQQVTLDFGTAQEVFAKENDTSVDPEDHPLEEEFEKYE